MPRKPATAMAVEFTEPPVAAEPERTDRAVCPRCGRRAYVRGDGTVQTHRSKTAGERCDGKVPA